MSKRLIDSGSLWKESWFRSFPPLIKLAFHYIFDLCDSNGIWVVESDIFNLRTGLDISFEELLKSLGEHIVIFDNGSKVFIPYYIRSQYKNCKDTFSAKSAAYSVLSSHGLLTSVLDCYPTLIPPSPQCPPILLEAPLDYTKLNYIRSSNSNSFLENENFEKINPEKIPADTSKLPELVTEWGITLKKFKINKDPKFDEAEILRMMNRDDFGFEKTKLAIIGQRYEAETATFNPAKHILIQRLSQKLHFEKMVNLGSQDQEPLKAPEKPQAPSARPMQVSGECQWCKDLGTILAYWREDPSDVDKSEDFACPHCKAGKEKRSHRYWQDHHSEKYIPRWEKQQTKQGEEA